MKLEKLVKSFGLEVKTGSDQLQQEVTGGYAGDLLSDVIAHSARGNVWITIQTHPNIVAVASLKDLAAIIIVGGREPDPETLKKAAEEVIPLLISLLPAFELIGRLYQTGVPGIVSC